MLEFIQSYQDTSTSSSAPLREPSFLAFSRKQNLLLCTLRSRIFTEKQVGLFRSCNLVSCT